MLRKRFPLLVILLLSLQTAAVRTDKVDDYVKAEMQKQRIPGLSLAVVKEGKVIKAEGYGLANVEHNVPARPETVYKIASVSKQLDTRTDGQSPAGESRRIAAGLPLAFLAVAG
jgi:CubicO group peptidase (beta-lactamase class C family)